MQQSETGNQTVQRRETAQRIVWATVPYRRENGNMGWWKKTGLMICLCTALSFMAPDSSICAEAALNIEDVRQASAYQYDLVSNMRKTPNQVGTWVKSSKGYRFKLKTNQYLKNGWARIEGRIYCFDANGYRRVGFYTYRNRKYYFKSNGQLAVNYWLRNGDRTCYLKPDGTLAVGMLRYGGNYYYFNERGLMVRGWTQIDDKMYYFREDGTRASGWEMIKDPSDGKTYRHYFSAAGTPVRGWKMIDGKQYHLTETGRVTVGWEKVHNNYWCYFEEDGSGAIGWKEIEGSWYCFSNEGIMLVNQWVDGYYLGSDGRRVEDTEERTYIFCGDSRTVLMSRVINNPDHLYVARSGCGYFWFRSTGMGDLQKYLEKNPKAKIILNLGVNDVGNCEKYINLYKDLFKMYPMAKIYIMSVNPVDDINYPEIIERHKSTAEVEAFNKKMKAAFPTRYIDAYSYLKQIGFGTIDGVHYTDQTYRDIYQYVLSQTK